MAIHWPFRRRNVQWFIRCKEAWKCMSLSLQDLELSYDPVPQDRFTRAPWLLACHSGWSRGFIGLSPSACAHQRPHGGNFQGQVREVRTPDIMIQSVLSVRNKLHLCTHVSVCSHAYAVVVFFVDLGWVTLSQGKGPWHVYCSQAPPTKEKCYHPAQRWSNLNDCLIVTKLAGEWQIMYSLTIKISF